MVEGSNLRVNGQKSYVTGGAEADFINTLVHVEDRGPSMVVIDRKSEGVIIEKKFVSLDGSHHAIITFKDVSVPVTHIIGEDEDNIRQTFRLIAMRLRLP